MKLSPNNPVSLKIIRLCLGYLFLILGMLGGFIPFLQGWIFVALGLVLLKDDARWARKLSIWARRRYPSSRPVFKRAYKTIDNLLKKTGLIKS